MSEDESSQIYGSYENTFTPVHVKELYEALEAGECIIDGKSKVPSNELALFFRNPVSKEVHVIDFPQEPGTNISTLLDACSPAAFGRGSKDVLDPSYRKALKLDSTNFAINFSPERLGIIDQIEKRLGNSPFEKRKSRGVYAELYKLNCYSQGDFFKAHKDTPRAANMLGSLVVNLPTVHSGGELIVRRGDGTQHTCDWSQPEASNVCSWVAFYSDMEHEVQPVTLGHRITLTYNIYFQKGETCTTETPLSDLNKLPFFITLNRFINEDPTFLPFGGVIISFLAHQYPNFREDGCGQSSENLTHYLKGNDRALFQIAEALGLFPMAKALISPPDRYSESAGSAILTDTGGLEHFSEYEGETTLDEMLWRELNSSQGDFREESRGPGNRDWITRMVFLNGEMEAGTEWKENYLAYGNEASIRYMYGRAILAMHVRPWGEGGRVEWGSVAWEERESARKYRTWSGRNIDKEEMEAEVWATGL